MRMLPRALSSWAAAALVIVSGTVLPASARAQVQYGTGTGADAAAQGLFADSEFRLALMRAAAIGPQDTSDDRAAVRNFISCNAKGGLWSSEKGPSAQAGALISELDRADEWGLNAGDFKVSGVLPENPTPEQRAAYELSLSLAAVKYAKQAHGSRIPDPPVQLASYLDRRPALPDADTVLADLAQAEGPDAYLRSQHPQHPQFEKLRQEYLKLRVKAESAVTIPPGPALRPGETHDHIALLRKRLNVPVQAIDGVAGSADYYDSVLAAAVKKFQKDKGLSANGTLGSGTRRELNDGAETVNPDSIIANMEAWRWMPQDLGEFHVEVNVPEFTVRVLDRGNVVHTERVVTGKKETQTPIFSDMMRMVVFQPQWGLPDSIKVNEVLPRLLRGDGLRAGYKMQRNGRDVDPWSVNWNKANILDYHVFQPSGDDNALGQVKFLFPNKHQVYMHDTPSKGLFSEKVRTYSHGCVRVRNPVKLAEIVLAEDKGWSKEKVRVELEDKDENNKVQLDTKVPVHIMYFTAAVDEQGKLQTFKDVYGHENRITLALKGRWKDIPKLPDHLAPVKAEQVAQIRKRNQQTADDEAAPRRERTRYARAEEGWSPPPRPRTPPARVYAGPPPGYYGSRSSLGRPVYSPGPKSFFQQLFGGN